MLKIDFIALNKSRRIQLQFATNRIKIGPLELEIRHAKGARRHYARPMTSCDVIGLPPVTILLVTLYNCFLTVEDYTKESRLTRNSRHSVTIQTLWEEDLCHYIDPPVTLGGYSPVSSIFSPSKLFTGHNFEGRTLRFFAIISLFIPS